MSATSRLPALALVATTELEITAGGAITVTGFFHTVAANGGGADNLDTITNGYTTLSLDGTDYHPFVYLKGKSGDTITVRHGQDNIDLPDDTDFVLATDAWTVFIWDGSNYTTTKAAKAAISDGEANTASNVGTAGVGVFKQKTGVDLEFKKINAGSAKITVTDDVGDDEVDIDLGSVDFSDLNTKTHTHADAANGGTLNASVIAAGTLTHERGGLEADVSAANGIPLITGGATSILTTITHERGGLEADVNAYDGLIHITGGATSNVKTNWTANVAPDADNDIDEGYVVGSRWIDVTADKEYVCLDNTDGAAVWTETTSAGGSSISYAILRDEKATTTDGGGCAATTWNNRDVNTEVYDPDNIVTIAANQFTPIAGDFIITVFAPCHQGDENRLRLYNVTGTASVDEGLNTKSSSAGATTSTAVLCTKFTANGTDAYRIDHYTVTVRANDGLGLAVGDGTNEVYMTIRLEKI